jgi:PAS domain S-box-containing protein
MKPSPRFQNEKQRLEVVASYRILDTADERDYNDIVELASQVCDTPISIITFVDQNRQWFKARKGLDIHETPVNISFCAHTIHQDDVMVIYDTLQDDRFHDNPLVLGPPHMRFYAGVTLVTPNGFRVGTLAVIDQKPRQLSAAQISSLCILARQVTNLLNLRISNRELTHTVQEKTSQMQDVLDRVSDAFIAVDKNWSIEYVNEVAARLTGRRQKAIIGKNLWIEFPEAFASEFPSVTKLAMSSQRPQYLEAFFKPYNRWFETNIYPSLTGVSIYFKEITERKNSEQALRDAEANYRGIFENAVAGMYQSTPAGKLITANPAMAEMLGYDSANELISSVADLETQLYAEREDRAKLKLLLEKEGKVNGLDLRVVKKNKEVIWVSCNIRVVTGNTQGTEHYEGTLEDITERRQMEERLHQQEQLDHIITRAQGLFIRSEDSRTAFDALLKDLLSITKSEYGFIGEILYRSNGDPYLKTHTITNIAWNEETRKYHDENIKEGLVFDNLKSLFGHVMVTGKPIISNNPSTDARGGGLPNGHPPLRAFLGLPFGSDGKLEGMLGLANRPNGYDEALIKFLEPLTGAITHLIEAAQSEKRRRQSELALMNQFEELQKTNRELDRFVYSASHDLRAPLASILGLVHIAEIESESPSVKDYLKMIEHSIKRLDGFIADILDYSRNSRKAVQVERIDFDALISETINNQNFLDSFERIKISVEINESYPFYSDRHRLAIILNNLLSNAIKYQDFRKEESYISLKVTASSNHVSIIIVDNGIGIEENHLDRIFDMFYRATDKAKGSGLGLYIAKETILRLGGFIKVESVYGLSTTFVVTIPGATPTESPTHGV